MSDKQKISIEAKVLAKAMKNAAAILSGTAILPIAGNARLIASGMDLEITTCDMEIEVRQRLTMPSKGAIETTVDAKRLLAVATTAPADAVLNISLSDGRVTITAGRGRWVLPTLPAADFPTLPVEGLAAALELPGSTIAQALGRVEWAIYTGRAQLHLQGAFLHNEAGKVRLAAANGNAMAIADIDASFPDGAVDAMLPTKLASTLASLCGEYAETVRIAWDDRKLRAEIGDCVLVGKLMDAAFPDYRRAVPAPDVKPVVADPSSITDALRRVMVISDEKTRCVRIDRSDGKITLASSNGWAGTSDEEIVADCDAAFASGINGQYLSQLISAIGGDSLELHQADARAPFLFRRVVDDGAFAIVMPMKLN